MKRWIFDDSDEIEIGTCCTILTFRNASGGYLTQTFDSQNLTQTFDSQTWRGDLFKNFEL